MPWSVFFSRGPKLVSLDLWSSCFCTEVRCLRFFSGKVLFISWFGRPNIGIWPVISVKAAFRLFPLKLRKVGCFTDSWFDGSYFYLYFYLFLFCLRLILLFITQILFFFGERAPRSYRGSHKSSSLFLFIFFFFLPVDMSWVWSYLNTCLVNSAKMAPNW